MINLEDYINQKHLTQDQYIVNCYPFEYFVINNFFNIEAFKAFQDQFNEISLENYTIHPNQVYRYAIFNSKDFIKLVYSNEFINFLNKKTGYKVIKNKEYCLPQAYIFDGKEKALKVHTDYTEDKRRDLGMIIYLHDKWSEFYGGQLNFFHASDLINPVVKLNPYSNSVVMFKVTKNSYHSLSKSNEEWVRKTIVVDWNIDG
jgi:Rps23 Pro-64 3,4-dihydroxylase Tpa1-like proline 4-hydroxylase